MLGFVVHLQSVLAGAAAGGLHVVTGPDHLAAVAPLAVRSPAKALGTGAAWGFGHAAGVLILGGVGTLARSFIPLESISSWAEAFVGVVLIAVGAWGFVQAQRLGARSAHNHAADHTADSSSTPHHKHSHRAAFGVGMVHGAAGTGHLLGVIPSLALPVPLAITYLASYGLAAIAAMAGFGFGLGYVGHKLRPKALLWLMRGAASFACGLGVYWIVSSWPA